MQMHPLANIFPMMDATAFAVLAEDIKHRGLLHPITIYQGKILDGRNRLKACRKVGVAPRFTEFKGRDPLGHVVSLNLQRRHLTESQRAMLALDILPRLEEEAKSRQRMGKEKLPDPNRAGQARDHAARLFKVSGRYIQDAKKIASEAPDLCEKVRDGLISLTEGKMLWGLSKGDRTKLLERRVKNPKLNLRLEYQALNKRRVLKKATGLESIAGRFQVLYCDPPWWQAPSPTSRAVENNYPCMTLEQLRSLPVKRVSAQDSVLFMWTTGPRLKDAIELMESWGFIYTTNLCWVKGPQQGLGHWLRTKHETLLIGKRGKFPTPIKIPSSVLHIEQHNQKRRHSEKPSEIYDLIEGMWPGIKMRRLELFGRAKRKNWVQWGAESDSPVKVQVRINKATRNQTIPVLRRAL